MAREYPQSETIARAKKEKKYYHRNKILCKVYSKTPVGASFMISNDTHGCFRTIELIRL